MSWPRQGSQNPLDNRECKWKTWISWVWGFEVVHAVKGSFEVAPSPQMLQEPLLRAAFFCVRISWFKKSRDDYKFYKECASDAQLNSVQVCAFRKIVGRHLTNLGIVASRSRGFVPHPPIPLLYIPPRKASLSRPLFGPKSSSRRLNKNQDPSKGEF